MREVVDERPGSSSSFLDICDVAPTDRLLRDNVKALIEMRDQHPIRKFPVYGNFVIQRWNYQEIEQFDEFCLQLGFPPNMNLVVGTTELLGVLDDVGEHLLKGIRKAQQFGDTFTYWNHTVVLEGLPAYKRELQKLKLKNLANRTRVGTKLLDIAKRVHSSVAGKGNAPSRV